MYTKKTKDEEYNSPTLIYGNYKKLSVTIRFYRKDKNNLYKVLGHH